MKDDTLRAWIIRRLNKSLPMDRDIHDRLLVLAQQLHEQTV